MELKQHYNYVVVFQDGRFKIGRTCNPTRRLRELREGRPFYGVDIGRPVSARVALLTETHVRRALRSHALPGTLEWFYAPRREAALVAEFTAETQSTFEAAGA